jgi:hypothetical protein
LSGRGVGWTEFAYVFAFFTNDSDIGQNGHIVIRFPKEFEDCSGSR